MSATPRRLALGLLVALLVLPATPAGAVPFDTSFMLRKLRGLLSFIWAENGCILEPAGLCGAVATPNASEVGLGDRFEAAVTLIPEGSQKPILSDNGCEIEPAGSRARSAS